MRCSTTGIRSLSSMLAIAGIAALAPVFAKEPAETEVKSTSKGVAVRARGDTEPAAIPECLAKLNLSPEQQTEIQGIVQKYDGSLGIVWKQFGDRYMHMIGMESAMLAAIEDNLTEPQREQVRAHRRKTAHQEKLNASTSEKPNQATVKPANAVESAADGVAGVALTPEQEAASDKIQEKYHAQLHSCHRDIQGLHARLLSLDADKMVQIEKVLTKEQLSQLRAHRETAPVAKVVAGANEPTKTE